MSRAEFTELAGVGVVALGFWLMVAGLFGAKSPLAVLAAGLLLVFYGGAIIASANKHRAAAARLADEGDE